MYSLFKLIDLAIDLFIIIVIIRVVLSWIPHNPHNSYVKLIHKITEPPLAWIRQWVPDLGGFDISPMILIIALMIAERIVFSILL